MLEFASVLTLCVRKPDVKNLLCPKCKIQINKLTGEIQMLCTFLSLKIPTNLSLWLVRQSAGDFFHLCLLYQPLDVKTDWWMKWMVNYYLVVTPNRRFTPKACSKEFFQGSTGLVSRRQVSPCLPHSFNTELHAALCQQCTHSYSNACTEESLTEAILNISHTYLPI